MIQLEPQSHGVFWARLVGSAMGVIAVRCDPWEAMRVATMKVRMLQARSRQSKKRNAGMTRGLYSVPTAKRLRPDPYSYLNRTDEEVGHIAHIEEGSD